MSERTKGVSLTAEVKQSVAAVWKVPAARTLVGVVGSQYILVGALDVLYVVLAITTLGVGESYAGYFNSAFGAGGRDRRGRHGGAGGAPPSGAGAHRRHRHGGVRSGRPRRLPDAWPAPSLLLASPA